MLGKPRSDFDLRVRQQVSALDCASVFRHGVRELAPALSGGACSAVSGAIPPSAAGAGASSRVEGASELAQSKTLPSELRCWMLDAWCSLFADPLAHPAGVRPRRTKRAWIVHTVRARARRRMGFGSYKGEVVVLFLWAGAPAPANVCCVVAGVRGAGLCRRSAARSRKVPLNRLPLRCHLVAHLYRCATRFTDDQEGAGVACSSGGSADTPWSAQACLRLVWRSLLRREW